MSEDVKVLELRIDQDRLVDVLISDQMRRLGDLPGVTIVEPNNTGVLPPEPLVRTVARGVPHKHDPENWVAKVRVTHKGYGMVLSQYIAYALPEGVHELYVRHASAARAPVDTREPYYQFNIDELILLLSCLDDRRRRLQENQPKKGDFPPDILEAFVKEDAELTEKINRMARSFRLRLDTMIAKKVESETPPADGSENEI